MHGLRSQPERRARFAWHFLSLWPWPVVMLGCFVRPFEMVSAGRDGLIAGAIAVSGLSLALQMANPVLRGRVSVTLAAMLCLAGNLWMVMLAAEFMPRVSRA